jgi:hypothetical protein
MVIAALCLTEQRLDGKDTNIDDQHWQTTSWVRGWTINATQRPFRFVEG